MSEQVVGQNSPRLALSLAHRDFRADSPHGSRREAWTHKRTYQRMP